MTVISKGEYQQIQLQKALTVNIQRKGKDYNSGQGKNTSVISKKVVAIVL
jgi:hypothetical protein